MEVREKLDRVRQNIEKVLVTKPETIDLVLIAILSRGHVLIEDVPGIGKTTLVRALAASVGCTFQRIQFTPDVMPSDVTGFSIVDLPTGELRFKPGAIMHQVLLADEINRTSPKTQSALLEAMQEGQVTIDGTTHPLPKPFFVLATQNPVEHTGTFPLPEAQLDRFFMKISIGYPSHRDEMEILSRHDGPVHSTADLSAVIDAESILEMQQEVDKILCSRAIKEYITLIVRQTRSNPDLQLGLSPRAAIALMQGSKASALLSSRAFVTPDDVLRMTQPILAHRLILRPEARLKDLTSERILKNITNLIKVPDIV